MRITQDRQIFMLNETPFLNCAVSLCVTDGYFLPYNLLVLGEVFSCTVQRSMRNKKAGMKFKKWCRYDERLTV